MTGYYRWDGKYVPPKNKAYQDTYDELERIYQEVKDEAQGYTWIIQEDGSMVKSKPPPPKGYDFGKLKPVKKIPGPTPPEPPEPQGVTLEELFAEDEDE